MSRFPWDTVKGWKVTSRADGTMLIEPDYISPHKGPEEGGGPGIFTRLALAYWCQCRLAKRRPPNSLPAVGRRPIGGMMAEWSPIETLPTDGSYFLAVWPDGNMVVVHYSDLWGELQDRDEVGHSGFSHWMPLPKAPSAPACGQVGRRSSEGR